MDSRTRIINESIDKAKDALIEANNVSAYSADILGKRLINKIEKLTGQLEELQYDVKQKTNRN